jgi:hypothetical protein
MRNKHILILSIACLSLASCKKFLDRSPIDKLNTDQTFSSENNLQLYVNSFYARMLPTGPNIYQSEVMSDITVPRTVPQYISGSFNAQNVTGWDWTDLRNVNFFIQNNHNPAVAEAARNHYTGIARFFRAWFYFKMVSQYGDVPWYGKAMDVNDPDLYKPRDSRVLVMDSVLADLDYAIAHVYATKDNTATQITKWTALALKSRVCLFEGTFRKYHNVEASSAASWLEKAAAAASELMASNQYKLYNTNKPASDYRTLFISENPVSTEVLLAAVYNNTLRKWHGATQWYNSPTAGDRLSLSKRFVNTYLNADGSRFTDIDRYDTLQFYQEITGRDMRLKQTIRGNDYRRTDGSLALPDFAVTTTGYHILKFSLDDKYFDTRGECFNSMPIIRYAEVLLNYAEAKAELGTFTAADWDNTIKALRARAGIANAAMPAVADTYLQQNFYPDITDPVLLEIRRERAVELAGEGFRYDDLKRWKIGNLLEAPYTGMYVPAKGQLLDLDNNGQPDVAFVDAIPSPQVSGVTYVLLGGVTKLSEGTKGNIVWLDNLPKTFDEKRYFYPIPANELLINPALVQNDGW